MRATGIRSFRFSKAELGSADSYRVRVLAEEAGLWWKVLLTTRAADRRWAYGECPEPISRRFTALALEHAAARKAGRTPDPEVDAAVVPFWWRYWLMMGRMAVLAAVVVTFLLGAGVLVAMALAGLGLAEFTISTR